MIAEIFRNYPGLSGLFISALFSASLSTLSSILAGLSAVTVEDFIRPHFTLSDSFLTVIAKVTVVVYGGVGIAVAFIISQLEGSLTQILFSVMGAATGPLVGIFFLSMFFRRATDKGAIIGGITGIVFTFWICIGSTVSRDIPRPRPLQLPPITSCSVINSTITTNVYVQNSTLDISTHYLRYNESTTRPDMISNLTRASGYDVSKDDGVKGIGKLYTLSYALFSTIGTLFTIFVGIIASLITYKEDRDKPDSKYLMPLCTSLCCCFTKVTQSEKTSDNTENVKDDKKVRLSLL
jgi:Na+/proline symporter